MVPLVLVHHTVPAEPAGVDVVAAHASAEEAFTAIAAQRTIVLARGLVAADGALLGAARLSLIGRGSADVSVAGAVLNV